MRLWLKDVKCIDTSGIMPVFRLSGILTMATYSTNEFRSGLKVMLDGDPCSILENEFVKPGKGQAFNRVKLRFFLLR